MIVTIILSCLAITASSVPVNPSTVAPLPAGGLGQDLPAQGVPPVEATSQKPEGQVLAQIQPGVQEPLPAVPQQPGPQGGPVYLPPLQYHPWSTQGGSPMMLPVLPNVHGPQFANQQPQPRQPLIFPPYGYFPVFSSQPRHQPFSPYGFPMIFQAPVPQNPANQPPINPLTPAETPSGPTAAGIAPQPTQQQQSPHIVYTFQQPMNSPLGALSSEELEVAARMGRLGVYLPSIHTNMPVETAQPVMPVTQATGPVPASPGLPDLSLPAGGVAQTQGLHPGASNAPVGLKTPGEATATVQTPVQPDHQQNKPGMLSAATPPPLLNLNRASLPESAPTNSVASDSNNDI